MAGALVAGLVAVLAVGTVVSGVVHERSASDVGEVGVARVGGTLRVVSCRPGGLRSVELQTGTETGELIWRADVKPGHRARGSIDVVGSLDEYVVSGPTVDVERSDEKFAVRKVIDADGHSLLRSLLVFVPNDIPEGQVNVKGMGIRGLQQWLDTQKGCAAVLNG